MGQNITHSKTESVQLLGLMNSATKSRIFRFWSRSRSFYERDPGCSTKLLHPPLLVAALMPLRRHGFTFAVFYLVSRATIFGLGVCCRSDRATTEVDSSCGFVIMLSTRLCLYTTYTYVYMTCLSLPKKFVAGPYYPQCLRVWLLIWSSRVGLCGRSRMKGISCRSGIC